MASSGSAYPEAVGCSCWLQLLQISRQFTRRICGRQAVAAVPIDPEAAAAVPIDPEADKAAAKSCEDIFQAAKEGNVGAVRHFLRVDPGSRERKGGDFRRTPLHWAAKYRGFTALHLAAERGHAPVAEQLISAGATVDAANKGETALHWAALNGHAAVVELLISLGAKVDAADNRGWMPLHCAARGGHAAVVELLISLGAKVDAADNRGETPYDLAKVWGHRQVMGLLRPAKAAVPIDPKATAAVAIDPEADKAAAKNCKDIFQAVEEGNLGAVRHFLRVDPESLEREDVVGWTPLHQAAEQGHVEVVALLLKSGASAEVEDDIGRRPQSCRSHGNCVGEESR